jgi:beta-barrel assembly-enhancing protease
MQSLWPVAVFAAVAAAQPGNGINRYSITEEVSAGRQMARQYRADTTPLANAAVGDYVNRVGAALAEQLPGFWSYRFEIIREDAGGPTHEPVAFPGGPIFISVDLIAAASNEAEFAAMLAHAMVHVAERHWTKNATRAYLLHNSFQPPRCGAAHPPEHGRISAVLRTASGLRRGECLGRSRLRS